MSSIKKMFALFLVFCMQFLTGCAQDEDGFDDTIRQERIDTASEIVKPQGDNEIVVETAMLTLEEATQIAVKNGVNMDLIVYSNLLPYAIVNDEAQMEWGFIEKNESNEFTLSFVSQETGEMLELHMELPENIASFVTENNIGDDIMYSSTPNAYDSFPWGWRLPFESSSNVWMTCGYGCGYHTGNDAYATDWDPGNEGHLLESVASCWVISVYTSSSYGNQVVAECGDAGSSQRYYYRAAHMRDTPLVSVGQWIGKGRNLGYMGSTGWADGAHIHYVVYRGTMSGSSLTSGGSLPINRWPSSTDSLCDGDLSGYNFATSSFLYLGTTDTTGCP